MQRERITSAMENDPSGPYSNGKWSTISCWQPLAGDSGANALLRLSSKRGPQLSLLTLLAAHAQAKGRAAAPGPKIPV